MQLCRMCQEEHCSKEIWILSCIDGCSNPVTRPQVAILCMKKGLDMRNELNCANTRTEHRSVQLCQVVLSALYREAFLYTRPIGQYQTVPQLSIVTAETLTQEPWSVCEHRSRAAEGRENKY